MFQHFETEAEFDQFLREAAPEAPLNPEHRRHLRIALEAYLRHHRRGRACRGEVGELLAPRLVVVAELARVDDRDARAARQERHLPVARAIVRVDQRDARAAPLREEARAILATSDR